MKETKTGRGRMYDISPIPDVPNRDIGYAVAVLNELSERVFDQISDLPQKALVFVPEGSYLPIGKLVLHLAAGEAGWMKRISGKPLPSDLEKDLAGGSRQDLLKPLASSKSASELIALCRRVREGVTKPVLSEFTDIDTEIEHERGPATVREGLMHLVWHWIYHSGHIGLTRLLWGSDYDWTFA
jgi:uncharacterized damage-inducible protein DinB